MKSIGRLIGDRKVHTLPASSTVLEAARTMSERRVGAILVTGEDGKLVGIFTERDLMSRVVVPGRRPSEVRLEEVMSRDLTTATPDRSVNEVARELQDRHIRHLPVVLEGEVLGILSLRDLMRALLEEKSRQVDALTAYIQGEEPEDTD